ncbi:hypothetical protein SAY86_021982 [Trapa natans]|uniref:Radical S-adenosyl methionine domain-containing protein 1, mitochondrial n=1 Tax=Trapa natans TaxID=22666 RepID=A0AAN7M8Z5_TRANT|nr:hypothetical protein SAY86_021982 [Trapa natans]
MMKSTFTPIFTHFSAIPSVEKVRRLRPLVCISSEAHRPPVRQNAAKKAASSLQFIMEPPKSAYIHLPFCRKRCHYCDFPVVALGSRVQPEEDPRIMNYVELLCREIEATRTDYGTDHPLETIFFGGGTPSLVPPGLVSSILELLKVKFGVSSDAEISMEMDPGTFNAEKLVGFMELGVNRVSLGVQAFQEELLKACGRAHGLREVHEAIEIVNSYGVENWSMDLISSLPHQTHEMWEESLEYTLNAKPSHISVYDLQVEQGTKFGSLYTPGEFPLPSDTQSSEFYRTASKMLSSAGYSHYEISSYSLEGFQCKHNSTYWKCLPFYGFGLGSASYINGSRFSRPKKMKEYMSYVQKLVDEIADSNPSNHHGHIDTNDLATDIVMLSLRTSRGLNLRTFREAFGDSLTLSLCQVYSPYLESGHVVFLDDDRIPVKGDEFNSLLLDKKDITSRLAYIRLSDPDGFLLSNELISLAFGTMAS